MDPRHYHEETKHHFQRFARSPGFLDWANQPNPFRSYAGARSFDLPRYTRDDSLNYDGLFAAARPAQCVTQERLAGFLALSLGISAWKSYGSQSWPLRINPSSGNLHPTETHLLLPGLEAWPAGVYHYAPLEHRLELRRSIPATLAEPLFAPLQGKGLFLLLSSIHWRETWKYGDRSYRYCQLNIGHALGALAFAANLSGWRLQILGGQSDAEISRLAGFDRVDWPVHEEEHPALLAALLPWDGDYPYRLDESWIEVLAGLEVQGKPNPLSAEPKAWPAVEAVGQALVRGPSNRERLRLPERAFLYPGLSDRKAEEVIRERRSAQAYDCRGTMPRSVFLDILDRTLPRANHAPFAMDLPEPSLHAFCFVHAVEGLEPGLYALVRNEKDRHDLVAHCAQDFLWERLEDRFPLYLLKKANYMQEAQQLSCNQEIAGDSCFSLGLVGRFASILKRQPTAYRDLHWEAGLIGQVLYLAAEAHDFRGTGIGCFFDDPVHQLLGLENDEFQSLYHFTVGKPLIDRRLMTTEPKI